MCKEWTNPANPGNCKRNYKCAFIHRTVKKTDYKCNLCHKYLKDAEALFQHVRDSAGHERLVAQTAKIKKALSPKLGKIIQRETVLRPLLEEDGLPVDWKQKMCLDYLATSTAGSSGYCPKKSRCNHAHDPDEQEEGILRAQQLELERYLQRVSPQCLSISPSIGPLWPFLPFINRPMGLL
jgi:hypothetical protein